MDYDVKNFMHCCRLLLEAEHIVEEGRPLVDFRKKPELQKFLVDIRSNKYTYDWLLKWSEEKSDGLKERFESSDLPKRANMKKIDKLFLEIVNS